MYFIQLLDISHSFRVGNFSDYLVVHSLLVVHDLNQITPVVIFEKKMMVYKKECNFVHMLSLQSNEGHALVQQTFAKISSENISYLERLFSNWMFSK